MSIQSSFGQNNLRNASFDRRFVLAAGLVLCAMTAAKPLAAANIAELTNAHVKGSTATVNHAAWDKLLKTFVVPGNDGVNRVRYAAFKAEGHAALKAYVASLESSDLAVLDRPEQFAFWANLYNAKTIDIVLDKYPVKSIKDISLGGGLLTLVTGGPWKAKVVKVKGQDLSLDDIEHGILRPTFKDPRVHYAVNCASFGCPNLATDAFTGRRLDALLDAGAKAYVNHPRGVRFDGGKATMSSIYSWFQSDFGGSEKGVLDHMRKYANPEIKAKLDATTGFAGHDYDWTLNEAK